MAESDLAIGGLCVFIVEIFTMKSALPVTRLCFDILFRGTTIGAGILVGMQREGVLPC